ncbi:hypothetical protein AVEN_86234-1 [Araneus ventricosus]|uniref:Uncharacterized protein n=1 Tax=Araneus ventricosus TaxID=182803 RepID=A0A4Y2IND8_ARAVE|nr:hypothetical protein AVEN_86234-1 [Araneus ventricosus]
MRAICWVGIFQKFGETPSLTRIVFPQCHLIKDSGGSHRFRTMSLSQRFKRFGILKFSQLRDLRSCLQKTQLSIFSTRQLKYSFNFLTNEQPMERTSRPSAELMFAHGVIPWIRLFQKEICEDFVFDV